MVLEGIDYDINVVDGKLKLGCTPITTLDIRRILARTERAQRTGKGYNTGLKNGPLAYRVRVTPDMVTDGLCTYCGDDMLRRREYGHFVATHEQVQKMVEFARNNGVKI